MVHFQSMEGKKGSELSLLTEESLDDAEEDDGWAETPSPG